MFHLLLILNHLPHVLRDILWLCMLRKTLWQTYLPDIPFAPCSPLLLPAFLQLREGKHLFLTSEVEVTLTRVASVQDMKAHMKFCSPLLPAMGIEGAWIFPMGQPEGSDEPGLLSDNAGLRPLTALQEHKAKEKFLSCQIPKYFDCFYSITKLIKVVSNINIPHSMTYEYIREL